MHLSGMDTLSREETQNRFVLPSENWSALKGKNLSQLFFPFRVYHFSEGVRKQEIIKKNLLGAP